MDELISSRASSAPQPGGTPANRDTAHGQVSGVSPLPEGPVPIGSLVSADELPDGVVVADEAGRIIVFNRVAARLTGLDPAEVIGKFVFDVLPLRDAEGRDWWVYADPYHGLPTRTRHPERSLYLADGTEILVSVGYVREDRRKGGARGSHPVRRLVISLRGAQQREHVEHELADDLGRVEPGEPGGHPVEDDDAAHLVGDHHPVRQLVREDQAPDRDWAFRERAGTGRGLGSGRLRGR